MATRQTAKGAKAAQDFVPIEAVRDGIVVLKDKSLRGVLMASSINLALKSQDEQSAVLFQFQNFLNSLDFSVQFFVQSRELDIRPYLALLEERYLAQNTELMKIQVREYIEFVRSFTDQANIMSKSFFIVVPYSPAYFNPKKSGLNPFRKTRNAEQEHTSFEESLTQLEQRMSIVESGLSRTGVRVARLGTEEVIELFYKMFNIGELERPIPIER